jgi:hypothetical protein
MTGLVTRSPAMAASRGRTSLVTTSLRMTGLRTTSRVTTVGMRGAVIGPRGSRTGSRRPMARRSPRTPLPTTL